MESLKTNAEPAEPTANLTVDQGLQQAVAYHRAGQLQNAERFYRAILQAQPKHPDANHNLGVLAVQVKQPLIALAYFKTALEANPSQGQYWASYIDALIQAGQGDLARQVLTEGRKRGLSGDTVELLTRRLEDGELSLAQQQNTGQPVINGSLSVDQAMGIANEKFKARQLADAESIYRSVLSAQPNHAIALHNLGLIAHATGQFEVAIEFFKKATVVRNNVATFHNNLGEALRAAGQFDEAINAYRRALSLEPNDPDIHNNLGIALRSVNKINDAGESFQRAVDLRPDYYNARVQLARIMMRQGRTDEALRQLDLAVRHAKEIGFPMPLVGMLYARLGKPDAAKIYLRAAIERDPTDSDGSGLVLAALGQGRIPSRASDAHMTKLYEGRSKTWDSGIGGDHSYRGMDLVAHDLRRYGKSGIAVLDAGCGTGLVGARIRDLVSQLDGVDLSLDMLAKAREKAIYDLLHHGNMLEFMLANPKQYDAIASAATLIHFGDLTPIFRAVVAALKPGGLFVFTVFPNQDENLFSIGPLNGMAEGGCYLHGKQYLIKLALEFGFMVESIAHEIHEYLDEEPVMGLITTLRLN